MGTFRYNAKNQTGQTLSAVLEAADEKSAVDQLRKQGLVVISVTPEKESDAEHKAKLSAKAAQGKPGRGSVKLSELVLFTRQLATMIESGIPLVQSLDILFEQVENKQFKTIIAKAKDQVAAGSAF